MKVASMRASGVSSQAIASAGAPARAIARPLPAMPATMRHRHIARAGGFDEGAAQVRRLLDRDRKELDLDEMELAFAEPERNGEATASEAPRPMSSEEEATPANSGARFKGDKTPVSPFGPTPASSAATSPFANAAPTMRKPFGEPAGLSPDMQPDAIDTTPWWTKITLTQIVITLSFTTIIGLMIATFFFVLNVGAVRFNE